MRRKADILKRLELRIKHGVAKPSPLYEALRRNHARPPAAASKETTAKITLPTDRLEREFGRARPWRRSSPSTDRRDRVSPCSKGCQQSGQ